MPNHVDQDLYVTGPTEALKAFQEFAKEEGGKHEGLLSANKFIPYPQEYLDQDVKAEQIRAVGNYGDAKDGFNSGGYEWCIENWGTKWGIYSCACLNEKLDGNKGQLKYGFKSAWSPPLPVIEAMGVKFPMLKFRLKYYERGGAFKGTYVVENGDVVKDVQGKYNGNRGG